jgi:ABC-type bacteriocin/lantibiotic exporter with double-glycine peptidase domain
MWNGQILTVILNLGTLAYGGHLVMNNRLNISNFVSFILYQQRLGDIIDVNISFINDSLVFYFILVN